MACAPSEDSDQPGHPPSLIRIFAVRMKKPWVLSYPFGAQRRLWSDWADAQTDLSLRWAHRHFVCFVMTRLTLFRIRGNIRLPHTCNNTTVPYWCLFRTFRQEIVVSEIVIQDTKNENIYDEAENQVLVSVPWPFYVFLLSSWGSWRFIRKRGKLTGHVCF